AGSRQSDRRNESLATGRNLAKTFLLSLHGPTAGTTWSNRRQCFSLPLPRCLSSSVRDVPRNRDRDCQRSAAFPSSDFCVARSPSPAPAPTRLAHTTTRVPRAGIGRQAKRGTQTQVD